ncbi:MAG: methyl-accepting chemotaxis protein [Desulfobacterium sp.]|nr:methyl-accepting chemotaxis protein [Desulfobacterium sp.]
MWRSLSIANKIWLSLSILIIGYFASMLFGYSNGKQTENRLFSVSESVFPATRFSQTALNSFGEQIKLFNDAVLIGDTKLLETAQSKAKQIQEALSAISALPNVDTDIKEKINISIKELFSFSESANTLYTKMITNEDTADMSKTAELAKQTESLDKQLTQFSQYFVNELNSELSSISQDTKRQRIYSLTTFFIVVAGSVLLIWFILSQSIIQPLKNTVDALNAIAHGDLSVHLNTGKDEIGIMGSALNSVVDSLNIKAKAATDIAEGNLAQEIIIASEKDTLGKALLTMITSLNNMVSELNFSAAQVDSGSRQIADSSIALSQGATEQAAAIQEISSSMTQISSQTKTNAENAAQANTLAKAAHEAVRNGIQQMEEMVSSMDAISESSNEIGKIIKTIDDIAFQTNLLALNAAVEAARAGKHGKGFAVVAQEVRSLAARSAKAAQETTEMIEKSIKKVKDGNQTASKTSEALEKINTGVTQVTDLVGEIAAASSEQAQGIAQVNKGLQQVDNVTQSNTANAEETSSAAETLSAQAAQVHHLLSRFRVQKDNTKTDPTSTVKSLSPPPGIQKQNHKQQTSYAWGKTEIQPKELPEQKPEQIIALDDSEFGKY